MPVYTFTTLDDPLGTDGTEARGINDAGQVVGIFTDASTRASGFLYSNGTYTTLLDPLGTGGTFARGISNAGETVGVYSDANHHVHGFFYSGGTFSTLDDPLGTDTFTDGINNAGQIVGEYNDFQGHTHDFIYDPTRGIFPPLLHPRCSVGLLHRGFRHQRYGADRRALL
jgi:probable HAF family extracellular repeat protein